MARALGVPQPGPTGGWMCGGSRKVGGQPLATRRAAAREPPLRLFPRCRATARTPAGASGSQEGWPGGGTYNFKAVLEYDGTDYRGFQLQLNDQGSRTVQGELEAVLGRITGEGREVFKIQGAGRTDTGVHAVGQVIHFRLNEDRDPYRLRSNFNGLLPMDIRVREVLRAPTGFNARYHAETKIYHYHITTAPFDSAFSHRHRLHIRYHLDPELMREGAAELVGTHNWLGFTTAHKGDQAHRRNPHRTVARCDVVETGWGLRIEVEGDGFLYRQVRNMVGTLLAVGSGKIRPIEVRDLIAGQDRRRAPTGAPPHGLFLYSVAYPPWEESDIR